MSIIYNDEKKQFVLNTVSTCYMIGVTELGHLLHYYYGPIIDQDDESYLFRYYDHGFSGNPIEKRMDRTYTLDRMSKEYPSAGVGDYRISGIAVENSDGSRLVEFRYKSHEIRDGKYTIPGLPCAFEDTSRDSGCGDSVQTLVIELCDASTNLKAELYYGVFEEKDIITRSVKLINNGSDAMYLDKASSACLDLPFGKWDVIHFHGRHCMERQPERVPVFHGIQSFGSGRGMSSHHQNPFVIICDRDATEDTGCCYGMMLVYSGNHKTEIEMDQFDSTRIVMGINEEYFRWRLDAGSSFDTPQVLLTCADGLTKLSHNYHGFIRDNIIKSKFVMNRQFDKGQAIKRICEYLDTDFWNDYLLPSLVLQKKELYTIPIATQSFYGTYSTDIGLVMAALLLAMLPILILYVFLQKFIVKGVTSGAVKG